MWWGLFVRPVVVFLAGRGSLSKMSGRHNRYARHPSRHQASDFSYYAAILPIYYRDLVVLCQLLLSVRSGFNIRVEMSSTDDPRQNDRRFIDAVLDKNRP